ncbi:hypothetical protein [Pseudomonas guariconensis]|uniref:hypothetical protein n=1 Tax=Pseudomonas guariconensis TaxID=1288410 RepID=UPI00209B2F22|nr:hypothetical protein [Pseudomonas guariconensis]MCO7623986.1 hypothetical protein [Pseudomonas guariconensis]
MKLSDAEIKAINKEMDDYIAANTGEINTLSKDAICENKELIMTILKAVIIVVAGKIPWLSEEIKKRALAAAERFFEKRCS